MAVVAVFQALQGAVLLRLVEELVDLVEQAVVFAGGHRPALVAASPRSKATRTLGKYTWFIASSLESTRVRSIWPSSTMRSRSTTSTASDSSYSSRVLLFQLRQLVGVAAALEHHDLLADQALGVGGARRPLR
jgi:hypothetical protein